MSNKLKALRKKWLEESFLKVPQGRSFTVGLTLTAEEQDLVEELYAQVEVQSLNSFKQFIFRRGLAEVLRSDDIYQALNIVAPAPLVQRFLELNPVGEPTLVTDLLEAMCDHTRETGSVAELTTLEALDGKLFSKLLQSLGYEIKRRRPGKCILPKA